MVKEYEVLIETVKNDGSHIYMNTFIINCLINYLIKYLLSNQKGGINW